VVAAALSSAAVRFIHRGRRSLGTDPGDALSVDAPSVDVADETFLAVPPAVVAAEFADPQRWPRLWPDLRLAVVADRGVQGVRWTVSGALVGSMEVWLEPVLDGTVLHYYLRADPVGSDGHPHPAPPRRGAAEARRRRLAAKAIAFGCKERLEAGREPGEPPAR
jgi:hypothetical protein